MTGLLVSARFAAEHRAALDEAAAAGGIELDYICLPPGPDSRLGPEELARVDIAFFTGDTVATGEARGFFAAAQGAPNLRWMQVFHAGVDNAVFTRLLENGVRLSTASGSTAEPIANSVLGGMLILSRGFLPWLEAQHRAEWRPHPREQDPRDLRGQHLAVLGLGAIGNEIARLATAFGMRVTGVRRSPLRAGDHAQAVVPPAALLELLPTCDWLAVACPLTPETRGIIGAEALAALPRGACVVNIARGEVIDEPALIAALQSGHLGGAYLDVFAVEPLPADSPLWAMPNVIISPHNSPASTGNDGRVLGYLLRNLARWGRGEPLENEVHP